MTKQCQQCGCVWDVDISGWNCPKCHAKDMRDFCFYATVAVIVVMWFAVIGMNP